MRIGEICTKDIVFVDCEESIRHAAGCMLAHHVGSLVVTKKAIGGTEVLGIVTDRDIAVEAVARGVDAAQVAIGRIASPGVASLPADADLGQAIETMKDRGIRRLLVVLEDGRVHGIVSLDDLLAALGHELAGLAHALHKGIGREAAERSVTPRATPQAAVRVPYHSCC